MQNSNSLAMTANTTNKAVIAYDSFCKHMNGTILPIVKRQGKMDVMTRNYVDSMYEIATCEETMTCFLKEVMRRLNYPIMVNPDVDNQASAVVETGKNDTGGNVQTTKEASRTTLPRKKISRLSKEERVKLAIEKAKEMPVAEGTNAKYSHYVTCQFKISNGELIAEGKPGGWNERAEVLETIKTSEGMHMKDKYKNVEIINVDDYVVYLLSSRKCQVSRFSIANGVEPYVADHSSIPIPEEIRKEVEFYKDLDSFIDSNYKESNGHNSAANETADTVPEEKVDVCSDAQGLIEKAVELTKSRGVGSFTNPNAPYLIQDEFKVKEDGYLERVCRPFSRNICPEEIESMREKDKKRAQTYNAIYVSSADDYTAYICNGGKSINVYYYNAMSGENN